MATFFHGSSVYFEKFDLSHALEGDGKAKFGYGIYVAGTYESAAHYAFNKKRPDNKDYYVYTVEVPDFNEDNCLSLLKEQPVAESIVRRAEEKLGELIPAEAKVEAWYHAQQFLAWLKDMRGKDADIDGDFERIDLDNALLDIQTIGPLQDGWYAVLIQFERAEPLNLCVDGGMYVIDPNDYQSYAEFADAYMRLLEQAGRKEENDG